MGMGMTPISMGIDSHQRLCVPTSSSASERVFSTAGRLLEKRRTNLSSDSTKLMVG